MDFTSFVKDTKNTTVLPPVSTLITSSSHFTNLNYSNFQSDQIPMENSMSANWISNDNKESASGIFEDLNIYCWTDDRNPQMQEQSNDTYDTDNFASEASNNNDRPNTDGALYSVSIHDTETESMDALDFCNSPALLAADSWFQACSLTATRSTTTLQVTLDNQENHQEQLQAEELQPEELQQEERQLEEYQQEPEIKSEASVTDSSVLSNNTTANQKSAAPKSSIRTEQRGEKPLHYCTLCGRGLSDKAKLADHMMIHTGEKPYSCTVCNKSFRQRNHLTRHTSTHSEEKPFSCTVCGNSFRQKTSLNQHIKTHTKPYSCTDCDRSFSRKYDLTKHVEKGNCSESRQQQQQQQQQN